MNEQPLSDTASAFKARLDALRSKGPPPPPTSSPSLKERLHQTSPSIAKNPEDLKARIQSRFQQKPKASVPSQPSPLTSSPVSELEKPVQFEETPNIPEYQKSKQDKTDMWSLDLGGLCPSCQTFNLAGVVFCGSCNYMLLRAEEEEEVEIVTSYPLKELKGLAHTFVNKLQELNILSTEDILRVACNHKNRAMISKRTGLSERSILRLVHTADMCRVPSMGPESAAMLELLAITTLADMLKYKPSDLHAKIHQNRIKINQQGILFMPTKNQVNQWIEEARALPPIRIT